MSVLKGDNYTTIQGWMLTDLCLKGNELLIYAVIYGFSQSEGQVFSGSLRYLAEWTNSTKRGVMNNLKSLVEKGYIGKRDIVVNGVKFCEYYVTKFTGGVKNVQGGVEQSSIGGMEKSSPNNKDIDNKEDIKEINKRANKKALENEFERLWQEYPKKQGKENALKAYIKERSKRDYGSFNEYTVLDGIKRYKRYIEANKIEPQFIKQGSTWFNQHCWEDDYSIANGHDSSYLKAEGDLPF